MEKEIDPESNTTDGEEGTLRDKSGPADWTKAAKQIEAGGKDRSLADLLHAKEFAALDMSANIMAWSKVRFLIETEPEKFARFLGSVKGQLDEQSQHEFMEADAAIERGEGISAEELFKRLAQLRAR